MVGDCVNPIRCWLTDDGWRHESLEQNNYQRVVALANEGLQQKDIAAELELSKSQVSKLIKKAKGLGEVK
jgi:DNA-binding transcriptional regulator LsrR (DeoR family)